MTLRGEKKTGIRFIVGWLIALVAVAPALGGGTPLGTAFTYQGQLKQNGAPVNERVDFRFTLRPEVDGGPAVGSEIPLDDVEVVNGLFTVELDFGAGAFNGEARWLEVSVRAPHDPTDTGLFVQLEPRTPITPAPYALQTRGIFVDDAGHVGIGPGPFVVDADLQIGIDPVTNTVFGGTNLQIGDSFAAQLILGRPGADYMQIISSSSGNRVAAVGAGGLEFSTGSNTVDAFSRLFISPAGNVGIGTTAPTAKLDIAPAASGPTLRIPGTLDVGRNFNTGIDRPFVGIGIFGPLFGNESLSVYFPADDTQPFGGMSIATPSATGLPYYGYATQTRSAWSYLSGFDGAWRLHVGSSEPVTVTADGKIGLGGQFPSPTNTLSVFGSTDVQGNLGVGTTTPANRLTVVGDADVQGSVGIGTTTPGNRLVVVAANNGDGIRVIGSNTSGTKSPGVHLYDSTTQRGTLGLAKAANAFSSDAEIGDIVLRANTGKLLLQTGTAASGMSITAGGVGIGVANPGAPLHIAGEVRADGGVGYIARNPNNVGGIAIFGWLDDVARLRVGGTDPGGSNGIDIQTLGDRSLMRLLNNGNVGIGTTTPANRLHVFNGAAGLAPFGNAELALEDDSSTYLSLISPDANESGVLFGNPTNGSTAGGILFNSGNPNGLSFRTGTNDTQMVIDSSGRLGLGTPAPSVKAEFVSNGTALRLTSTNDDLPFLDLKAGTTVGPDTGGIRFLDGNNTVLWQVRADTFGEFSIRSGTTSRLRINPSGDNSEIRSGLTVNTLTVPTGFGILNVNSPTPGRLIRFNDTDDANLAIISEIGSITYSAGGTVSYNAFTGGHYAWSAEDYDEGTLVSMTGVNRRCREDGLGEPIYGISKTVKPNHPAVLGTYAQRLDIGGGSDTHLVSSVGNGELCVVDRGGGDIEPGDYLISSDVPGCAMKDDPAKFPIGHVIAKAADRITWSGNAVDERGVRRARISVLFTPFVRSGSLAADSDKDRRIAELEDRLERIEQCLPRAEAQRLEGP